MRNWIILIITVGILIYAGIWQIKYIEESSIFAISDVDYTVNLINNNNFIAANSSVENLEQTWKNMQKIWATFINHKEIDDVVVSITNLKMYTKLQDKKEALVYAEQLKQNLDHISKKQKIRLENVL